MVRNNTFRLAGIFTLVLFLSCTGDESPSGVNEVGLRATLGLVPTFPATAAADDTPPIVRIRATVKVDPPGTVVSQQTFDVDPNSPEWELDLAIELRNDPSARYTIDLELMDAGGVVVWSARFGPVRILPGLAAELHEVAVGRGPLTNVAVTGLSLSGPSLVPEGEAFSLDANVQTSDGSVATVIWTSLTPAIASIGPGGLGVALSPGTAEIQGHAGQHLAVHSFEVVGVAAAVVINPGSATLANLGQTVAFDAVVVDSRGNPTGDAVTWSVEDDRILADLGGGAFEAVGGGETNVVATAVGNPALRASAPVVVDLMAVGLFIDPQPVALSYIGATTGLSVTGVDVLGTHIFGLGASWSSSDPAVAGVDQGGTVTGLTVGSATVTADVGGLLATVTVTVSQVVTSLTLTPLVTTLTELDLTVQYTAVAQDAGGTEVVGAPLTWMSANTGVATIDNTGLATSVGNGDTEITVTSGGASAAASLTVMLPVARVTLTPSPASVPAGREIRFTAMAFDASDTEVAGVTFAFESSDQGVLIMFSGGLARASSEGVATVTATEPGGLFATTTVTVTQAILQPRIEFQVQPPGLAFSNQPFSPALTVQLLDSNGQLDTDYSDYVELFLVGGGGSAQLVGVTMEPVSSGIAQFDPLSVDLPGSGYQILAQAYPNAGDFMPATSTPFDVVVPQALANSFYETAGNTVLLVDNFPSPNTAHVHDFNNPLGGSGATVTVLNPTTVLGGTVVLQPNGNFSYMPPRGITGQQDSFTLTTNQGTATVFIEISDRIWYVDATLGSPSGTGRSDDPVNSIAAAVSFATGTSDLIHVLQGSYTEDVTLGANNRLWGHQGTSLQVQGGAPINIVCELCSQSIGVRPMITASSSFAIVLASGVAVTGFDVVGGNGGIFGGGNLAGANVSDVTISGTTIGLSLDTATGAVDFQTVDISGTVGSAISVASGDATITFDGTATAAPGNWDIFVQTTTGGSATFTGGPYLSPGASSGGVFVTGAAGDVFVDGLDVRAGSSRGIQIANSSGTYQFDGLQMAGTTFVAFEIGGGTPTVVANVTSLSNAADNLLLAANTTGGSVTFNGGTLQDTGGMGIRIDNTLGPVVVNSPVTVTNPGTSALTFTNAADATFASFSATTSNRRGIDVGASPGTLTILGGSLDTTDQDAIFVQNSIVDLTFGSVTTNTCGEGIRINQAGGSTTTIGLLDMFNCDGIALQLDDAGTFTVTNPASSVVSDFDATIDITATSLNMQLGTASSTDPFGPGINISQSTGTFSATGGVISGNSADGVLLDGNNLGFTYGGTMTIPGGRSVSVINSTGGTYNFTGPITDSSDGIQLNTNTGTTFNFSGGLDITTDFSRGFDVVSSGTVNVTGPGNTITSQNSGALRLNNTTIGGPGVTFENISNSATLGNASINVSNTGTGQFTVTGDGSTPGSGGLLTFGGSGGQMSFNNVQTLDLRFMTATGSEFDGLTLTGVTNAIIQNSSFNGMGAGSGGDAITVTNPGGNLTFDNVTAQSSSQNGIRIFANVGSPSVNILNTTASSSSSGRGLFLTADGTAQITGSVRGSAFSNNQTGILGEALGASSLLDLTVGGPTGPDLNTIDGNSQFGIELTRGNLSTGDVMFDIQNNSLNNPSASAGVQIDFGGPASGTLDGFIQNNVIDGGSDGIFVVSGDDAVTTLEVSNNTITNTSINGLFVRTGTNAGDAGDLAITALGNSIGVQYYSDGIGISAEEAGTVCANIGGPSGPDQNAFTDAGGGFAAVSVGQFSSSNFSLERLVGTQFVGGPVEAQLLTDNPNDGGMGMFANVGTNGIAGVIAGTCRVPLP